MASIATLDMLCINEDIEYNTEYQPELAEINAAPNEENLCNQNTNMLIGAIDYADDTDDYEYSKYSIENNDQRFDDDDDDDDDYGNEDVEDDDDVEDRDVEDRDVEDDDDVEDRDVEDDDDVEDREDVDTEQDDVCGNDEWYSSIDIAMARIHSQFTCIIVLLASIAFVATLSSIASMMTLSSIASVLSRQ